MKNLRKYLAEAAREYSFVMKFAELPTQEQLAIIEAWLKRYDLKEFGKPIMIEHDVKDFIDIPNRQVHSVKCVLGTPISPYILLQDLKIAANISEKFLIIRNANDPIERYALHNELSNAANDAAKEAGDVHGARLSTDRFYTDAEQPNVDNLFGDDYNKKLLTYLAGVSSSRPETKQDPAMPLFSWLQLEDIAPGEPHQDTSDFNAHINTPKPVTTGSDEQPITGKFMNSHGSISDDALPQVKFYKDPKTGKSRQVTLSLEKK